MRSFNSLERVHELEQELHFNQAMIEALAQHAAAAFVVCDLRHQVQFINPAFEALFGWSRQELIGCPLPIVPQEEKDRYERLLEDNQWEWKQAEQPKQLKNHALITACESISPIRDREGTIISYASMIRDVTHRKQADRKLKESEQQFKSLFDNNPDAVISIDLQGHLISVNPATEKLCGYTEAEIRSKSLPSLCVPEHLELIIQKLEKTMRGRSQNFEAAILHKNGQQIELNIILVPISIDNEITGVYCIAKNITHRKQAEDLIQYMAYYDSLTDLPNRRMFERRLSEQLNRADLRRAKLAVLYLDLDGFKFINDSLGHAAGDKVIQEAAERIRFSVGEDSTIARMGGDEFTVSLPEVADQDEAASIASRILEQLRRPFQIENSAFFLSASIGLSMYPEDGGNAEALIRNADTALYKVKEQGKNHVRQYSPNMNEEAVYKQRLEREMHLALENEQFLLHYQPQIDVHTGKIIGMEALVRWQHPDKGLLYPGAFIPIAEASGLIVPIGAQVLQMACKQCRLWHEQGYPLRIAVNLSQIQLGHDELLADVRRVLADTQLPPACLELEITESIAMHNAELVVARLHELVALGVQISIDDFGTGFSSLSYLSKFPIHRLKIDRSFIANITNRSDTAIISSIVGLAQNLNIGVVVEGVETELQKDVLPTLGCFEMQGYLFSKPLPAEAFALVLKKGHL